MLHKAADKYAKWENSAEGREGIKSQKGSSARPRLIMLELQKSSVDFLVFNNKKHTAHSHRHTQTGKKKQKCVTLNEKKIQILSPHLQEVGTSDDQILCFLFL